MVDGGESLSRALQREFSEEALDSLNLPEDNLCELKQEIKQVFENGIEVNLHIHFPLDLSF